MQFIDFCDNEVLILFRNTPREKDTKVIYPALSQMVILVAAPRFELKLKNLMMGC